MELKETEHVAKVESMAQELEELRLQLAKSETEKEGMLKPLQEQAEKESEPIL